MKKAWVYGLAAMLGLGVSAVIANQASASAATVPIVIQSATSKCDTDSAPDHGASKSAIVPPLADNKVEVPIVTVSSDDDQKAGNTGSADSSSVSSSQQHRTQVRKLWAVKHLSQTGMLHRQQPRSKMIVMHTRQFLNQ